MYMKKLIILLSAIFELRFLDTDAQNKIAWDTAQWSATLKEQFNKTDIPAMVAAVVSKAIYKPVHY